MKSKLIISIILLLLFSCQKNPGNPESVSPEEIPMFYETDTTWHPFESFAFIKETADTLYIYGRYRNIYPPAVEIRWVDKLRRDKTGNPPLRWYLYSKPAGYYDYMILVRPGLKGVIGSIWAK